MIIVTVARTVGRNHNDPPVHGHAPMYKPDACGKQRVAGAVSFDRCRTKTGARLHARRMRRTGASATVLPGRW
jgi:hypothetical protein